MSVEILAPGGSVDGIYAAMLHGADAIQERGGFLREHLRITRRWKNCVISLILHMHAIKKYM